MRIIFPLIRTLGYTILVFLLWSLVLNWAMGFDIHFKSAWPGWTFLPGILILWTGLTIALICFFEFAFAGEGTFIHLDAPRKFVATGMYRFVRNPMYLGVLIAFAGYGLSCGSLSVLILSVLLFFIAHLLVLFIEEPGLERKFGSDYLKYKKSVGRWIPKSKLKTN
jgi:protein-S-isoprenylcysteine O-methyltransferase Ste14